MQGFECSAGDLFLLSVMDTSPAKVSAQVQLWALLYIITEWAHLKLDFLLSAWFSFYLCGWMWEVKTLVSHMQ